MQNLIESNHNGEQEKQDAFTEQEEEKTELERIIEYRTKGAILRARCRWHNEAEKIRNIFRTLKNNTSIVELLAN